MPPTGDLRILVPVDISKPESPKIRVLDILRARGENYGLVAPMTHGTGGTAKEVRIGLKGDHEERARSLLEVNGYQING